MQATGAEEGMFSEAQYNPVGSYIKYFDLDKNMCGKRIHICFEGVEEAMYLWLNGQFIGYAEDSFTPSEFDLTPYVKEKGNVLAVQVHKMSTAAFLEDQDFFRFFGIFRNVTLKAIPDVHLEDVWFKPVLNQDNESGSVSQIFSGECTICLVGFALHFFKNVIRNFGYIKLLFIILIGRIQNICFRCTRVRCIRISYTRIRYTCVRYTCVRYSFTCIF